jgi:uncharacterized membrane protein YfcA
VDIAGWVIFGCAVAAGSYVQSVAGFAMGMIVIAICGARGAIAFPEIAATVSLISFTNIVVALHGHVGQIDRGFFSWLAAGQLPAIGLGFWLMTVLDQNARWLLELLVGMFIACGSLWMMIQPQPLRTQSSALACLAAGTSGGIFSGMFAASGPVIGWFAYRQPMDIPVIRATVLAYFALGTSTRSVIVGLDDGLTIQVLQLTVAALPIVILSSWIGKSFPPRVSDATLKRMVFSLLFVMGSVIIFRSMY